MKLGVPNIEHPKAQKPEVDSHTMNDDAKGPVIAGLAIGLGFVVLVSSWSAFTTLSTYDFIKLGIVMDW